MITFQVNCDVKAGHGSQRPALTRIHPGNVIFADWERSSVDVCPQLIHPMCEGGCTPSVLSSGYKESADFFTAEGPVFLYCQPATLI